MFIIINLNEPFMVKLTLNRWIGNSCPEFRNGLLDSYFFKLTLGSDCLSGTLFLDSRFQTMTFFLFFGDLVLLDPEAYLETRGTSVMEHRVFSYYVSKIFWKTIISYLLINSPKLITPCVFLWTSIRQCGSLIQFCNQYILKLIHLISGKCLFSLRKKSF